ncbi:MAG: BLUF domain-containing protein [Acinetobacter sp.]
MPIQLCYASARVEGDSDLLQDLTDILSAARDFNHENQLYGVLYYSDGIYFQCLEGSKEILEVLFERIQQDRRHVNIHRFKDHEIEKNHFSKWSMKYVKNSTRISRFFEKQGFKKFQPHLLDEHKIAEFLNLLVKIENANL